MQENSKTVLPGATIYRPHQEAGIESLSILEEALQANREAEKWSTNKKVK